MGLQKKRLPACTLSSLLEFDITQQGLEQAFWYHRMGGPHFLSASHGRASS